MNHIILIGFMGAGKTTIGKRLAAEMEVPFVDTDELIEAQAQMKIRDIFSEYGEDYFRDLETLTLRQLLDLDERMVIAVGGGLPVRRENQTYLGKLGTVVYLTAEASTLEMRLEGSTTRPVLKQGDLRAQILRLMKARGTIYEHVAQIKVQTDQKNYHQIVEEIKQYV